tara:strand:- start:595 stop:801 length:207 start_codon:yes stop_codon:yes gene_type:complete
MDITVNGKPINVDQGTTVSQYLETLGFSERNSIAVALNKEIIQRESYGQTPLSDGDQLEIVKAIGGGF